MPQNPTAVHKSALEYAKCGLRVLPILPNEKVPAIKKWPQRATRRKQQIDRWFLGKHAEGNLGLATGNGIIAVDIDVKRECGLTSFLNMVGDNELPDTANAITASGGYHYLFRTAQKIGNAVGLRPGIDIRGDNGMIVVAPSSIPYDEFGRDFYQWVDHPAKGIAEAPTWLIEQIHTPPSPAHPDRPITEFDKQGDIGELARDIITRYPVLKPGTRNKVMCSAVCSLLSRRFTPDITEQVIGVWWEHYYKQGVVGTSPEQGQREIKSVVRSIVDSNSLVISNVNHKENIRAIKLTPEQISLVNSLGNKTSRPNEHTILHTVVTQSLDAMFAEALIVHFTYEMSKSEGPSYKATFQQIADIIYSRHGKKFNSNQSERLKKKYVSRQNQPAKELELIVQTKTGNRSGQASEYLLTGLQYFIDGICPTFNLECVGF